MTEQISRAIITRDGNILLCRNSGRDYFFFPGGHIEADETPEVALVREMDEEAGLQLMNLKFVAEVPHVYNVRGEQYEEINYVFRADIGDGEVVSREDHLEFFWISLPEFTAAPVLPAVIKDIAANSRQYL